MPKEKMAIEVERLHDGSLLLSTMKGGRYYDMKYMGYNKERAIKLFREWINKGKIDKVV
jgi:hypothetical protein